MCFKKAVPSLMGSRSRASVNCCKLTCALMVAPACLWGVLMGNFFWFSGRGWEGQINGGVGGATFQLPAEGQLERLDVAP